MIRLCSGPRWFSCVRLLARGRLLGNDHFRDARFLNTKTVGRKFKDLRLERAIPEIRHPDRSLRSASPTQLFLSRNGASVRILGRVRGLFPLGGYCDGDFSVGFIKSAKRPAQPSLLS